MPPAHLLVTVNQKQTGRFPPIWDVRRRGDEGPLLAETGSGHFGANGRRRKLPTGWSRPKVGSTRCLYQPLKEPIARMVLAGQQFLVPLDADGESLTRDFNRLHDAVRSVSARDDPWR